ncbi:MAG: SEC-C domain-containing protein [Oscillospiraceae bacterium]|nr:SEC-C domain-containing protein [Oscillospiraceae bacterium]
MKISRNKPCPCGSGKLYKRCCADKDLAASSAGAGLSYHNDNYYEGRALLNMIVEMQKIFLDKKPHIKQYKDIRKLHSDIMDDMMDYHAKGKFEQKFNPNFEKPEISSPGSIKIMETSFDPRTNEGYHGLAEALIFKQIPGVTCMSEDFIKRNHYRSPDKIEFLHSMLHSKVGLFEVKETDIAEAYVTLRDVFTGEECQIVDIGLSSTPDSESIYIYSRIISFQGVSSIQV